MSSAAAASGQCPGIVAGLKQRLASRRLPWGAALLAAALALPALGTGWQTDDYMILANLRGYPGLPVNPHGPAPQFSLSRGEPERIAFLRARGALPWWTPDDLRLAFWRPLAASSHRLDEALRPGSALLAHAHSVAWLAALVAAAAVLYRRVLGTGAAAGFAALLYAVDDAHGLAVGWVASRNVLMAALWGVLALIAHDLWRRSGRRSAGALAPLLLAAGLLSAEGGIGACAYLFAYAVFLDRASIRSRALSLLPYAAVVVAWRVAYQLLGYGADGSSFYVDPGREPLVFAAALVQRVPVLVLGLFGWPPSDAFNLLSPEGVRVLWGLGVMSIALLTVLLVPLARRDSEARFWTLGMALSLVPLAAVQPSDRVLVFAGLGAMGVLSQLLLGLWERAPWLPQSATWRRFARPAGWALFAIHAVVAPLSLPITVQTMARFGDPLAQAVRGLPEQAASARTLVMANAPSFFYPLLAAILRGLDGKPVPDHIYALSLGSGRVVLTRAGPQTLEAAFPDGMPAGLFSGLFRTRDRPLRAGDRVVLDGLEIDVTAARDDGLLGGARFRFSVPLEDASLGWVRWDVERFVPFTPPAPGASTALAPALSPFVAAALGEPSTSR